MCTSVNGPHHKSEAQLLSILRVLVRFLPSSISMPEILSIISGSMCSIIELQRTPHQPAGFRKHLSASTLMYPIFLCVGDLEMLLYIEFKYQYRYFSKR